MAAKTNSSYSRQIAYTEAVTPADGSDLFFQDDHCEWAWHREVEQAKKTLQRAGAD